MVNTLLGLKKRTGKRQEVHNGEESQLDYVQRIRKLCWAAARTSWQSAQHVIQLCHLTTERWTQNQRVLAM